MKVFGLSFNKEKSIEDFLCKDNNLEKHLGIRFLRRQYRTSVGIIDILGYCKNKKKFVIIEIKKDEITSKSFFQINRYNFIFNKLENDRWHNSYFNPIRRNRPFRKRVRKAELLLIGNSLHESLFYSVELWAADETLMYASTSYILYNIDEKSEISFNYYSFKQNKVQSSYSEDDV